MIGYYTYGISYNADRKLSPDYMKRVRVPRFDARMYDEEGHTYDVKGYDKKEVMSKIKAVCLADEA